MFQQKYSTSKNSTASPPTSVSNIITNTDEFNSNPEPHQGPECGLRESSVEWADSVTDAACFQVDNQVQQTMCSILDRLSGKEDITNSDEVGSNQETHQGLECKSTESRVECIDSVTDPACVQVDSQVQEIMCSILDRLSEEEKDSDEVNSYSETHQGLECESSRESKVECMDSLIDIAYVQVDSQVQEIMYSMLDRLSKEDDENVNVQSNGPVDSCTNNADKSTIRKKSGSII